MAEMRAQPSDSKSELFFVSHVQHEHGHVILVDHYRAGASCLRSVFHETVIWHQCH